MSFPETVRNKCGEEVYREACSLFKKTSCLQDGLLAAALNSKQARVVQAIHDVTECGVLGAIYEMAVASGCGVEVDRTKLPVGRAQARICQLFGIDPLYVIGAGSMIMAVSDGQEKLVTEKLNTAGIQVSCAGRFVPKEEGLNLLSEDGRAKLTHPGTEMTWKRSVGQ